MSSRAAYAIILFNAFLVDFAGNAPLGSLPLALSRDGATDGAVALAMGTGMFVALCCAIPIGALVDRFGRLLTLRVAAFLLAASIALLGIVHGALLSSVVMGLRGLAFATYMTAEFAYVSGLVNKERQTTAVGTIGMIGNLAFALAPAFGVWLWQHGVGREQYLWLSIAAVAGTFPLFALPAHHDVRTARNRTILMRSAWLPAMGFMIALCLHGGVNGALAVLTFTQRGIANGALIFTASALTTFTVRYAAAVLVDRFGARRVAIPTAFVQVAACILAARAYSPLEVIIAGLCFGCAWGAVVPIGLALFFEKSTTRTRGLALGAYNLAFNLGMASGALIAAICAHIGVGYTAAIAICAVAPVIAVPFVVASPKPPVRRYARSAAG